MSPELHYRRHVPDIEDLAVDFIEEEVGRHHWQKNWPAFKARFSGEALRARIRAWLEGLSVDEDPGRIVEYLDSLVAGRSGKWL